MSGDLGSGCPICRAAADVVWVDERQIFLVTCVNCTTFTITPERVTQFEDAWNLSDREILMHLEALSRYLRRAGEDQDRDVTDATWMSFALESHELNEADDDRDR